MLLGVGVMEVVFCLVRCAAASIVTSYDLALDIGRIVDGFADHQRRELHLKLVYQLQNPANALVDAVLKQAICCSIRRNFSICPKPGAPEIS